MVDRQPLADSFGRPVRTLRVSLTDHCNFRCVYCMPPEGLEFAEAAKYLSVSDIGRVCGMAVDLGVERIRITGGEPLVRRDVLDVVAELRSIPRLRELSMTTNGSRLASTAAALKTAGLDRINISLDSLDPGRFEAITRSRRFDDVIEGIEVAAKLGFPIKINVVIMSDMTIDEVLDFARLAYERAIDVRFLEFMPLCGSAWSGDRVLPIAEVREVVARQYELVAQERGDKPAETFALRGGCGRVGFIAPLSEPFCGACTRIRLTADGKIRPCLFSEDEYDLRDVIRSGSDDDLEAAIRDAVYRKPWGSEFAADPFRTAETRRRKSGPPIRTVGG